MERLFILFLAIVFCCTLLVGCGKKKNDNENSDNNVTDNSGTENDGVENGGDENNDAENGGSQNGDTENSGSENLIPENVSEGLEYTLSDDQTYYIVTGIGTCTDTDVVIPPTYNGLPVSSIDEFALSDCENIESITIPNSITSIGECALSCCLNLTKIITNESNANYKSVDGDLYTKDGKTLIQYAIGKANSSFTIPNSVTSIAAGAFTYCKNLTSVTISNSVTSIGPVAFCETPITTIAIPDSVTSIGEEAFFDCIYLTNVIFGESSQLTSIGDHAFGYCESLENITIPDSVTSIDGAFSHCSSLKNIIFGENSQLTSIGEFSFDGCESLTSVTIPNSVTSIGEDAFRGCESLESIDIPNSVISIGRYAFSECGLNHITIPNSVTSIGEYAFSQTNLWTAAIPSTVEEIGENAFSNQVSRVYCEFKTQPDSWDANWIGGNGNNVMWGITISPDGAIYSINEDMISYSFVSIAGCDDIIYSIPSTLNGLPVTRIQSSVFSVMLHPYNKVKSVIIPYTVTDISPGAFYNTWGLVEIVNNSDLVISPETIARWEVLELHSGESKITSVDDYLFYVYEGSNYLIDYTGKDTSLVLPYSYNGENYKIWNYVFEGLDLTSIVVPNTVTSIGYSAFYGCSSLTSINYDGTIEEWNAISKGSRWNSSTGDYTIYCTDGEIKK